MEEAVAHAGVAASTSLRAPKVSPGSAHGAVAQAGAAVPTSLRVSKVSPGEDPVIAAVNHVMETATAAVAEVEAQTEAQVPMQAEADSATAFDIRYDYVEVSEPAAHGEEAYETDDESGEPDGDAEVGAEGGAYGDAGGAGGDGRGAEAHSMQQGGDAAGADGDAAPLSEAVGESAASGAASEAGAGGLVDAASDERVRLEEELERLVVECEEAQQKGGASQDLLDRLAVAEAALTQHAAAGAAGGESQRFMTLADFKGLALPGHGEGQEAEQRRTEDAQHMAKQRAKEVSTFFAAQHAAAAESARSAPPSRQTRSMPMGARDEPHQVLITRGAAAYDAAVGTPPEWRGGQPYDGPTLRNGRVCIRASEHGGKGGRGLFPGPDGLKAGDAILYSGEVVSASEAKARKERGEADYILQLGYRDDSDRIDGCTVADAVSREPNAQGRYLPLEEWALDAGPGCMANEDKLSPNAKFDLRWLNKKRDFGPYRVIVPLRDIGPEEEIRPKYGSNTPRGSEFEAQTLGMRPEVAGLDAAPPPLAAGASTEAAIPAATYALQAPAAGERLLRRPAPRPTRRRPTWPPTTPPKRP